MLSTNAENTALNIVDDKIANKVSFTVFDITVATRKVVGRNDCVSHDEVRLLIHNKMLSNVDYDSEIREVVKADPLIGSSAVFAVVYFHPTNPDYTSPYTNTLTVSNKVPVAANAPLATVSGILPPFVTPKTAQVSVPKGAKSLDSKYRLRVPVSVTRSAGLTPWKEVAVSVDSQYNITIQPCSVWRKNSANTNGTYTIDQYGNIRIGLAQKMGLAQKLNYRFSVNGSTITATVI